MKHLKITFVDGTVEELESRWSYGRTSYDGTLDLFGERGNYGTGREQGPTYVLANIKKYEWVEGYK